MKGEFGRLSVGIENVPTASNPRTGVLAALSVVATLKRITSGTRVSTWREAG